MFSFVIHFTWEIVFTNKKIVFQAEGKTKILIRVCRTNSAVIVHNNPNWNIMKYKQTRVQQVVPSLASSQVMYVFLLA